MPVKKLKLPIALILAVFLLGHELTILGAYLQHKPAGDPCQSQPQGDSASSHMVCPMGHGTCTPEHPCCCCVGKYQAAKAEGGHNRGRQAPFIICSPDCGQKTIFSLPQFSKVAILTPEVGLAYQIVGGTMPDPVPPTPLLVYLPLPEKPPRISLA